jgi:hypothetical protein
MSKLLRLALAVALVPTLAPGLASAQKPAAAGNAAVADAATGLAVPAELLGEVAKVRGLEVLRAVPSGLKSRDDIQKLVLADMAETTTPAELAQSTQMLKFLGLVEDDFDLGRESVALLTEQIAGFYDPKTRVFYLADWIPLDEQKTVMVHELTHALADQHFDLRRLEKWPDGDSDAELAARALVEGDATALMIAFALYERGVPHELGRFPLSLTDMLRHSVEAESGEKTAFSTAPKVLRESLQFPYVYGAGFVQTLLRDGDWARVSDAYTKLPASTEQIMHPEKYAADERPVHVDLPDLSKLVGPGYRRVDADVNGEFGYFLVLDAKLGEKRAAQAAAGWSGDRYGFYLDAKNAAPVLVHESRWDSEIDAEEFFAAYAERTRIRIGATDAGERSPTIRSWQTADGLFRVERVGNRVLVVEGYRGKNVAPLAARLAQGAAPGTVRAGGAR